MADPLSVAASIIAVVGAPDEVTNCLRRLKAAKAAPESLRDLLEEFSQPEMVLDGIKSGVLSPENPPVELASRIREAGSKLLELRSLIEYTLTKAGVSDVVYRWQWLRKGNEVERLRNHLGTIRLRPVAVTSGANLRVSNPSKVMSHLESIASIYVLLAKVPGPALVVSCNAFRLLLKTFRPNSSDSILRWPVSVLPRSSAKILLMGFSWFGIGLSAGVLRTIGSMHRSPYVHMTRLLRDQYRIYLGGNSENFCFITRQSTDQPFPTLKPL